MKQQTRQLNPERRDRILNTAQALFVLHGLRGTSMEAIAREAGVAKPTLYAYFADKDLVFKTLARRIFEEWQALVALELSGPGPAQERIARALTAKLKAYFRLISVSPHAAELYGEKSKLLAEPLEALEKWLEEEFTSALVAEGHKDARRHVQVLLACAEGLAARARYIEEIGPAARLVVSKLLS
ncbi:MAG: TetR/AcrR family transcriptional regulator [Alphaproteobacteria bacterium]|nr:TetR/AcrR family transcriptional regulator [Alphaproteobacteria bacterium]